MEERKKQKARFFTWTILCPLFSIFLLSSLACAEAVYLKNGSVMSGRIVEKNDRYIVIQAGEGDDGAKSTIFVEDINRIEQDASGAKPVMVPQASYPEFNPTSAADFFKKQALPQASSLPTPSDLAEGQKSYQSTGTDEPEAQELRRMYETGLIDRDEVSRRFQGYFDKLAQEKITKETSQQVSSEEAQAPKEVVGVASISGTVVLPQDLKKYAGDLIVYAMREEENGRFVLPSRLAYMRTPAIDIMSFTVPYRIDKLADGRYKILAQWDIAAPMIREESIAGRTVLGSLGAKGDYVGKYTDVITLNAGEQKERIDFSCTQYLQSNQFFFQSLARPDFQVNDIYYRRSSQGIREFFMVVENRSTRVIPTLPLDIRIDDESFLPVPFEATDIKPGQEKEINITNVIVMYQKTGKKKAEQPDEGGPKALKIKVLWPATQEIEFEKTLYVI